MSSLQRIIPVALTMSLIGCVSTLPKPEIDWEAPVRVSIIQNHGEIEPDLLETVRIKTILRHELENLKLVSTTYPSYDYKLKLRGYDREGEATELLIFVGYGWIGDGIGYARLADRQAFTLRKLIEDMIEREHDPSETDLSLPMKIRDPEIPE